MSAQTTTNHTRQQVATFDERSVSFVPFGAKDALTLTVGMIRNFVAVKTREGHTPNDAQLIKFMMLCKARYLNPFEGDAYLVGYDTKHGPQFNLITAHQAFLKRAEVHPEFDGMESGVIVDDGQGEIVERQGDFMRHEDRLLGGWATVFFKSRSHPTVRRVNLKTFAKNFGRWLEDPAGMICKVAEADALRSSFPTTLGGMMLEQPLDERQPEPSPRVNQVTLVQEKLANLPPKRPVTPEPIVEEDFEPPARAMQPEPAPEQAAPVVDEYQTMLQNMREHIASVDPSGLPGMLELVKENRSNGDVRDEDAATLVKLIEARQAAPQTGHKRGRQ